MATMRMRVERVGLDRESARGHELEVVLQSADGTPRMTIAGVAKDWLAGLAYGDEFDVTLAPASPAA
ncbi:MAG: hypothetical protein ACRD0N_09730 [Acidimicrobiales bacterium]